MTLNSFNFKSKTLLQISNIEARHDKYEFSGRKRAITTK